MDVYWDIYIYDQDFADQGTTTMTWLWFFTRLDYLHMKSKVNNHALRYVKTTKII